MGITSNWLVFLEKLTTSIHVDKSNKTIYLIHPHWIPGTRTFRAFLAALINNEYHKYTVEAYGHIDSKGLDILSRLLEILRRHKVVSDYKLKPNIFAGSYHLTATFT